MCILINGSFININFIIKRIKNVFNDTCHIFFMKLKLLFQCRFHSLHLFHSNFSLFSTSHKRVFFVFFLNFPSLWFYKLNRCFLSFKHKKSLLKHVSINFCNQHKVRNKLFYCFIIFSVIGLLANTFTK